MPCARSLIFTLLIATACNASTSEEPASAVAEPVMMQHAALEPTALQSAEPRRERVTDKPAPKPAPTPAPSSTSTPSSEPASEYDRKLWPHWIDADRDCQNTRAEVLIEESYEPIEFEDERRCEVARGRWQCPYTGNIIAEAYLLDIDHLVPLANAHRSGAATWSEAQRRRYANDLSHPEHLVAVDHKANRSKGAKGPEAWLPPLDDARCGYVRDWVAVKKRWGLSMNEAEATAVADALELCAAGQTPPLPQARSKQEARKPEREPNQHAEQKCCRTCTTGKACGDSCISKTSTCRKAPGCACDG